MIALRIDNNLLEYLKKRAEDEHRTLSNMIISILLNEKERKEGEVVNADMIRDMSEEELASFIRRVYLAGKNGEGFEMFGYNLENWLKSETTNKKWDL